jgi:hypothetical protein
MSNLDFVPAVVRGRILEVLESPGTHYAIREHVMKGLNRDCVDAAYDAEVVAEILAAVRDCALNHTKNSSNYFITGRQ